MNGSATHHERPETNSYTSKGKEKPFCVCRENTAMNNITADSTGTYDGQETEDLEDDDERRLWEYNMKGFGLGATPQRETAVLMIFWAKELDDLHTEEEVNGLEAVFSNLFNYKVIRGEITGDKPAAIQLSKYLSDFVYTYDNESTLLIVYYAGHGVPKIPGGLHFAGNRQPDKKLSNRNAAAWHDVEHIVRDAEGDALLIFDCCYAGNLTLRDVQSSRPTRSFEYIAACGSTDETNFPGPESFTSAMIWALEDLVKSQKRFTTLELQNKIMNEAPSFPRKQSVLVMERDDPCDQRLVLAPLPPRINRTDHIWSGDREPRKSAQKIDKSPKHRCTLCQLASSEKSSSRD
ncbi:hypothetical protein G7Y89_g14124 [Cudoniella acicularis]|uniref:Peptidase C14 caspase domain-containing protein n=1 Tax=Cudoniella acicularis TaxID=354080 RepID=A0A8H4R5M7_9HELO|nr:hypothetical protein G7Y89_g14124 [Cudoniella acicularis]